jgi:hypothetical protein
VRFQTTKTIFVEDPELVLRALETCFQNTSLDVIREGPEIILHGLGPSPRAINRRDTAILRVETENNQTVIKADVTFQPSCLLGDTPQNEVVSHKLDQVFEQMSAEIAFEQSRKLRQSSPSGARPARHVYSEAISFDHQTETAPAAPAPSASAAIVEPAAEPAPSIVELLPLAELPVPPAIIPELIPLVEQLGTTTPADSAEIPADEIKPAPAAEISPVIPSTDPTNRTLPSPAIPTSKSEAPQLSLLPPAQPSHIPWPALITILCLALVAFGIYFVQHDHLLTASTPAQIEAPATPSTPAPAAEAPPAPQPAATLPAPASLSPINVADARAWLENWVAAMRTRDPVAQSSFYADPVDNYLGKPNVSRAEILGDKKASIQNRNGLWTVKLEKIALDPQSENAINVRLVKHYIAETEPAQISEQFVRSRLELKKIDGQWKITSEQDLTQPLSAE